VTCVCLHHGHVLGCHVGFFRSLFVSSGWSRGRMRMASLFLFFSFFLWCGGACNYLIPMPACSYMKGHRWYSDAAYFVLILRGSKATSSCWTWTVKVISLDPGQEYNLWKLGKNALPQCHGRWMVGVFFVDGPIRQECWFLWSSPTLARERRIHQLLSLIKIQVHLVCPN
jgi:hypothetical protein